MIFITIMADYQKIFTRQEIEAITPQQYPFLFLDEARITSPTTAEAKYKIKGDEFFLKGHFNVFPGTLLMEAMGQLAVFFLLAQEIDGKMVDSKKVFFISSDGVRCSRICVPGDTLEFSVKATKLRHPLGIFQSQMSVDGSRAAFAESFRLTFDYLK